MSKLKTVENNDGVYRFEDGSSMQREVETLTPNGCRTNGKWVYRDSSQNMLGFDRYSNDLASRFSLELYNLCT
jgi:hypothetical protein